jgi:hypothetical protein
VRKTKWLRLARTERGSDIRKSVRTMRKRNPEHYNRLRGAARHSPSAEVIRRCPSGRPAQCALGITIFFSNSLHQAVIVVLFDREMNDHGLGKYFRGGKITRSLSMKNTLCNWQCGRTTANRTRICTSCWKDREMIYLDRKAAEASRESDAKKVAAGERNAAKRAQIQQHLPAPGLF